MPTGKIKKLVSEKGFGFIKPDHGPEVFFHHSSVADGQFDSLAEGQEVEFELGEADRKGGKGPRASSVKPH